MAISKANQANSQRVLSCKDCRLQSICKNASLGPWAVSVCEHKTPK